MSRPKLMLQLVYVNPQPWLNGDRPPVASRTSSPVTIPWDAGFDSYGKSFEELIAGSLRKAIVRNPKLIDIIANLLAEKVKKEYNAKG